MSKNLLYSFFLFLGLTGFYLQPVNAALSVSFLTTGNCAICEIRIETAVSKITGVQTVSWDMSTDITTVEYDESVTDCFAIMHDIANVGHDTEWFRAPDSAYNLLIGSCCEYERVINYDSVQVGYLSLMGLWLYPLGIENQKGIELSVTPTIGQGLFQMKATGQELNVKWTVSIYNLNGRKVEELSINSSGMTTLDLQSFTNGEYIAILSDNRKHYSKVRLIKAD
jgi:copper chaperone CopZ